LLGELAALDSDSGLRRKLRQYAAPDVLIIDEVGYLSCSNRHADLLFELVSRRYQSKCTVESTNRAFADWGEVFPNAACRPWCRRAAALSPQVRARLQIRHLASE
jgi:DNA replication protein DnaC